LKEETMIPVFEPVYGEEEIAAVAAAMRRGELSGTFGESIPEFERSFAEYVGCRHGVAVSSGTTALHLAVAALDLQPGDEVLVSASTNIATALAVYHCGGVTVPVDSESRTWNLDLDLVESLITERTRAIMPVHLYGHPVDMDALMAIARRHNLAVIEDCAESHGATVRGRMTGSFGDMGCFSFYANKIITTGEGGMVTTNDDGLARRLRLLRNLAFTQPRFRHEVPGFNFRMTGMQAAMGVVQVRQIEDIIARKRALAARYNELFAGVPWLELPREESWARHVYWMYSVVVSDDSPVGRDDLMAQLTAAGIETRTFFCPMNLQPFLQTQAGNRPVPCPTAERLWRNGCYIPSSPLLTDEKIVLVAATISAALGVDVSPAW
jgi:perosamine synthetase